METLTVDLAEDCKMIDSRRCPSLDEEFYVDLIDARSHFECVSRSTVDPMVASGHAFRVERGQAFRLVMVEAAQIVDTMLLNGDDPTEQYSAGAQAVLEGAQLTRLTRVWGTPPLSRPLATVIADTVQPSSAGKPALLPEHTSLGGQCSPHIWAMFGGPGHRCSCYDNFRAALGKVGLGEYLTEDNLNLFQNSSFDPKTGEYQFGTSHAQRDDFIEFYAEIPLTVAVSICPAGDGHTIATGEWGDDLQVHPIGVEIYDTGIEPREWQAKHR